MTQSNYKKVHRWQILSPKQLEAWKPLETPNKVSDVLIGGGAGSGKSTLIAIWQFYRRIKHPGTRGVIGRAVLKTLKQTTLNTCFDVWGEYFHRNPYKITMEFNGHENAMKFSNGSEILFKDLAYYPSDPNFDRLGSLEITDAAIDEVVEVTQKAYEILSSRIRYKLPDCGAKILMTSNPSPGWVKELFVSDRTGKPITPAEHRRYIQARLHDNPDIDFRITYGSQLEKLSDYDRARLLDGDWEVNENDSPFFTFDKVRHVSADPLTIDNSLPLWLSFDFNVSPCTCLIFQKMPDSIHVLEAIQKDGSTSNLCDTIISKGYHFHPGGLMVTGDAAGRQRKTSSQDLVTDFGVIKDKLVLSDWDMKAVPKVNHNHPHSRRLCNFALDRLNIRIDPFKCSALVSDLGSAKVNANGTLKKDRIRHKQDAGDAFRYAIAGMFPGGFKEMKLRIYDEDPDGKPIEKRKLTFGK